MSCRIRRFVYQKGRYLLLILCIACLMLSLGTLHTSQTLGDKKSPWGRITAEGRGGGHLKDNNKDPAKFNRLGYLELKPRRDDVKRYAPPTCREKTNFVFIKGMKCATTTLFGVFTRFGLNRNLSFVLPLPGKLYLNWPYPLTRWDYQADRRGYNILTHHAMLSPHAMAAIMPGDSAYITIVRHPLAHLKSVFRYMELAKLSGIPATADNPLLEYFTDLPRYEAAYKRPGNIHRYCIPDNFSMTRNLQCHCLGLPTGFPRGQPDVTSDDEEIQRHIRMLQSKFLLVMVADHFLESLVLLRRRMCWTFADIVFHSANVAAYSYKSWRPPKEFTERHREWSAADFQLFEHFNRTLWRDIAAEGPGFWRELDAFRAVQAEVDEFCAGVMDFRHAHKSLPVGLSELVLAESEWTASFSLKPGDCELLAGDTEGNKARLQASRRGGRGQSRETDLRKSSEKGVC